MSISNQLHNHRWNQHSHNLFHHHLQEEVIFNNHLLLVRSASVTIWNLLKKLNVSCPYNTWQRNWSKSIWYSILSDLSVFSVKVGRSSILSRENVSELFKKGIQIAIYTPLSINIRILPIKRRELFINRRLSTSIWRSSWTKKISMFDRKINLFISTCLLFLFIV